MIHRLLAVVNPVLETLQGRPSLQFVILASMALFWIVVLLTAYMTLFRAYHHVRFLWRRRRRAAFEPGVEKVLMEEPLDAVVEAFRPRLPGDADIALEVMTDNMRHLLGAPLETLREAARKLGFVDLCVRRLGRPGRVRRGRAMEALGLMRALEARDQLVAAAYRERTDLKLVALRSLALLRDPADLPHFVKVSDSLPPAMLVRMASLMMEYGGAARPFVADMITRHPSAFTPRVMKLMLAESAAADGTPR